jgi:hypothetical protein
MEKYPVVKNFHDKQDVLKSEPKGRHYVADDDKRNVYPATKREVDPERLEFLQEEGFVGKEPIVEK